MILIEIENDLNGSLKKIQYTIKNNIWEKNIEAIAEARNRILEKYQFFPSIASPFKDRESQHDKSQIIKSTIILNIILFH